MSPFGSQLRRSSRAAGTQAKSYADRDDVNDGTDHEDDDFAGDNHHGAEGREEESEEEGADDRGPVQNGSATAVAAAGAGRGRVGSSSKTATVTLPRQPGYVPVVTGAFGRPKQPSAANAGAAVPAAVAKSRALEQQQQASPPVEQVKSIRYCIPAA